MRFFDNYCIGRNLECERSYKTERSTSILNDLKLLKDKKNSPILLACKVKWTVFMK